MTAPKTDADKPRRLPDEVYWLIGTLSLVLPWAGLFVGGIGLWRLVEGDWTGWFLLPAGCLLLVLDVGIDIWMSDPRNAISDIADLNQRDAQYLGRVVPLMTAIESGRGRVRLGDTVWSVAGEDMPEGDRVRIVGSDGVVLRVERA